MSHRNRDNTYPRQNSNRSPRVAPGLAEFISPSTWRGSAFGCLALAFAASPCVAQTTTDAQPTGLEQIFPASSNPGQAAVALPNQIRGLVKPVTRAIISSQIAARITELPFDEGERFKKGDTLVRFDCSLYEANRRSAGAEHEARRRLFKNNRELEQLNAIADIDVRVSEAEVRKAAADVQAANVTVSRCKIKAPFAGRVVERQANEHESVAAEQELMAILDDSQLEIELIVPSRWLRWLETGSPFHFDVDETGHRYAAKVKQIGASVDPVSQTIRVEGVLSGDTRAVLAGMSGTAAFPDAESPLAQSTKQ